MQLVTKINYVQVVTWGKLHIQNNLSLIALNTTAM